MGNKVKSVHFKVTGNFLTEHARSLVLEGNWEQAVDFLINSLMGFSYDFAIAVCSGVKKLIGNSDISIGLESDHCPSFIEDMQWLYAGYYNGAGNNFYIPYACVDNYGRRDAECPESGTQLETCYRACHYMDQPRTDLQFGLLVPDVGNVAVLFRRVPAPPLWLRAKIAKNPQMALDAYLGAKKALDMRGHSQWYNEDDSDLLRPFIGELDKNNENESLEIEEPEEMVKPTKDLSSDYGWIGTNGAFYACNTTEHRSLAAIICKQVLGFETWNEEGALEERGWVKVTKSSYYGKSPAFFRKKPLTQAQINTIFDWYQAHGEEMPSVDRLYGDIGD